MGSLQLKNIHKSFGNVNVLKGIDLDVKDGEFVIFVGPSGCGKSTLLRIIAGLEDANSTEFNANSNAPVVGLITEWLDSEGKVEQRDEASDLGGTMRLGAQKCHLTPDSKVSEVYGSNEVFERHRHRYEFNNNYKQQLEDAGLRFSGMSKDKNLVELIEIPEHPWFIACQAHPEFTSTPRHGHPLFDGFINAAKTNKALQGAK